jgi:hypothetical protein
LTGSTVESLQDKLFAIPIGAEMRESVPRSSISKTSTHIKRYKSLRDEQARSPQEAFFISYYFLLTSSLPSGS